MTGKKSAETEAVCIEYETSSLLKQKRKHTNNKMTAEENTITHQKKTRDNPFIEATPSFLFHYGG